MDQLPQFYSREKVFDFLDGYCLRRKEEIDRRNLGHDVGLVKSYVLETFPPDSQPVASMTLPQVLQTAGWTATPIEDEHLCVLSQNGDPMGYVEPVSARHALVHTVRDSRRSDHIVRRGVRNTALLDFLWLAGETFTALWDIYIRSQLPGRYVTMKFEHQTQFERHEGDAASSLQHPDWYDEEVQEQRASLMAVTERTQRFEEMLPKLREIHPAFNAIKMLRFPATDQPGGYEFWSWGKVTYRSPSFRDGREQIRSVSRLYEQVTAAIERLVWLQVERVNLPADGGTTLRGTPVVFQFQEPLSLPTFQNFVRVTFECEQGPLRLWGNPIKMGEGKVHVYGVDLHLWQRIYLEITRRHLLLLLPRGTCGNTVHRLLTNLQRYLDAGVSLRIGDVPYADLVRDVAFGKEAAGHAF